MAPLWKLEGFSDPTRWRSLKRLDCLGARSGCLSGQARSQGPDEFSRAQMAFSHPPTFPNLAFRRGAFRFFQQASRWESLPTNMGLISACRLNIGSNSIARRHGHRDTWKPLGPQGKTQHWGIPPSRFHCPKSTLFPFPRRNLPPKLSCLSRWRCRVLDEAFPSATASVMQHDGDAAGWTGTTRLDKYGIGRSVRIFRDNVAAHNSGSHATVLSFRKSM